MALALLLGIRDNLDTGIAAMYRDAGCSHILALSGMHLAVLVALISLLLKKPLGLRASALIGSCIIIAYCFLVGPLPSLNRAALMYLLGVLAVLGMLQRDLFSVLCMAFIIQLAVTPKAGNSLSFILSYLALAGILLIGESINGLLKGKIPALILQPISASLGAFIITAGVTAWFFGTLRPVGIIAGLALAPLAMIYMVAAMVWLGVGLTIPALLPLLEKPLILLYRLMEKIASLAAQMPGLKVNPYLVLSVSLALAALAIILEYRRGAAEKNLEPFE
jgi:competence protein ComEC